MRLLTVWLCKTVFSLTFPFSNTAVFCKQCHFVKTYVLKGKQQSVDEGDFSTHGTCRLL